MSRRISLVRSLVTMSTIGNEPSINTITEQLRRIVLKEKIDHKAKIYEQPTLKDACIYCKIHEDIKPQSYGTLIESYVINKYNVKKNDPAACIGDICIDGKCNYEVKVSLGGKEHNKFNFVQIRMNHVCDYLFIAYYLSAANIDSNGELFVFKLGKDDIKPLILKYGGLAHGTTTKKGAITQESIDVIGNQTEYALRPKYGDACWTELVNHYRVVDYETVLKLSVGGTVCTGIKSPAQCNATASTLNSSPPEMGLNLSVGGTIEGNQVSPTN